MTTDSSAEPKPTGGPLPPGGNWFIGVAMSDDVRAALARAQDRLRRAAEKSGASCSWVHPEDFHITVVFIGPWTADRAAELARAADAAAAVAPGFGLPVRGVGFFGSPRSPRILWAGIQIPAELEKIRRVCLEKLADSCGTVDARPYRPHVTLARVRRPPRGPSLTEGLQELQDGQFGTVPVHDLRVMRSVPGARGPKYAVEWTAPLAGA